MDKEQIPAGEPAEQPLSGAAEEIRHPDGRIEHPAARYEPSDIHFRRILALLTVVACVAAMQYYGVWRFLWFQEHAQAKAKQSPYPLASAPSAALPPQPRLEQLDRMTPQESAAADRQLAAETKALHSYGATAEEGFVQIPIEQAMKAVAGNLPLARGSSPGRAANGLLDAGQSNSGRMFRGPSP
jgi:hypothetical protein